MKKKNRTNKTTGMKNRQMPLGALIEHGIVRESSFEESKGNMFLAHPEIYQFAFGIINACEKLRKSKQAMFQIKKTADNNWYIESDELGTEILSDFQSNREDLQLEFPLNSLHPAINICESHLEKLHYLANTYSSKNSSRHILNFRVDYDYTRLKVIVEDLRIKLNQPSYNEDVSNFLKSSTNNEKSISKYLNRLKKDKKELSIERMQLSFKKTVPSMQPMGELEDLKDPYCARRCEDFKETLLKNVVKEWKGILVGYISKTHYTHHWGFVVHLILIFDGAYPIPSRTPNLVGNHWTEVTRGEGKYEMYKEKKAKSTNFRDFGIGFYGTKDKAKFAEFVEKVVIFLARTDKYLRFAVESPRIDSLKRGSPAMAKAKNESNGYDSSLPAIIQLKNKPLIKPYCS